MSPLTIRPAKHSEVEAIRLLARRSVAGLSGPYYTESEIRSAVECLTIPDIDLIDDGTMFVGEMEGAIVGCGGWSKRKKLYTGSAAQSGDSGYVDPAVEPARIRAFFVDPEMAGKGIARAIFERCRSEALQAGFRRIELMATLPGVPLYERLGFSAVEPTILTLTDGTNLPCLKMTIELT